MSASLSLLHSLASQHVTLGAPFLSNIYIYIYIHMCIMHTRCERRRRRRRNRSPARVWRNSPCARQAAPTELVSCFDNSAMINITTSSHQNHYVIAINIPRLPPTPCWFINLQTLRQRCCEKKGRHMCWLRACMLGPVAYIHRGRSGHETCGITHSSTII